MAMVCYGMHVKKRETPLTNKTNHPTETEKVERHIGIIDDILDDLLDNTKDEDDESTKQSESGSAKHKGEEEEGLRFFVSTKTKVLKTTVTSTITATSYHTCYKGKG